jgi:hypothetical protein
MMLSNVTGLQIKSYLKVQSYLPTATYPVVKSAKEFNRAVKSAIIALVRTHVMLRMVSFDFFSAALLLIRNSWDGLYCWVYGFDLRFRSVPEEMWLW